MAQRRCSLTEAGFHRLAIPLLHIGANASAVISCFRLAQQRLEAGRGVGELTPSIRSALIDRVVDLAIVTPTALLAERTVAAMLDAVLAPPASGAAQIVLPFELYGPENI